MRTPVDDEYIRRAAAQADADYEDKRARGVEPPSMPIVRSEDEFLAMISAAWSFVESIDGEAPRPRIFKCKLHEGYMIFAVLIGDKHLTLAMPIGALKGILN